MDVMKVNPAHISEFPNGITVGGTEIKSGGARTASVVVAASDSLNKEAADYICDGANDQDTINLATAAAKDVFLMEGNYSAIGILVHDNTYLHGAGWGTKITAPTGETGAVIRNADYVDGNAGIIIDKLFIDGNSTGVTAWSQGVRLQNCSHSLVKNVWAQNCKEGATSAVRGIGIILCAGTHDTSVTNCFATTCGHEGIAVRNDCYRCAIENNVSWSNAVEGIQVASEGDDSDGPCHDISITNNLIFDHPDYGGITVHGSNAAIKRHSRIKINNNTIVNSGCAVILYMNDDSVDTYHEVCNNTILNTYTHSGGAIAASGAGHNLIADNTIVGSANSGVYSSRGNNTISRNKIYAPVGQGIIVAGGAAGGNCLINKNHITDSGGVTGAIDVSTSHNTINNNHIDGANYHGVLITGEDNAVVGNKIKDCVQRGIRIQAGGDNSVVMTNTVASSSVTGISVSGADCISITNNKVSDTLQNGIIIGTTVDTIVHNNYVLDNGINSGDGIYIAGSADNTSVQMNKIHLSNPAVGHNCGIQIGNGATDTLVMNNDLRQSTSNAIIHNLGTATVIRNNRGFVTEKSGTDTVAAASQTKAVTHGLAVTPVAGDITITPTGTWGAVTQFHISAYSSTTFTVTVDQVPGGAGFPFAWKAIVL